LADLRKRLSVIEGAYVLTIPPPRCRASATPVAFKMMLEDRAGLGSQAAGRRRRGRWSARPNQDPSFAGVFTLLNTGSPQGLCRTSTA